MTATVIAENQAGAEGIQLAMVSVPTRLRHRSEGALIGTTSRFCSGVLHRLLCALLGPLIAGLAPFAFAAEKAEPLPKFTGQAWPESPQQHAPWHTSATTLSTNVISAVATLFDLGLADPRGCEYREVEVVVGSVWGHSRKIETRGWVLPSRPDLPQPFAVSWAGTIYPVLKVGKKADLRQDVEALLKADEPLRKEAARGGDLPVRWGSVKPEAVSLSCSNMQAIKVALLLRLDERELAEQFWAAWRGANLANETKEDASDPFRTLAAEWIWALFDRALCAHLRGDDNLALADCRRVNEIWPRLEIATNQRRFETHQYGGTPRESADIPHFGFLQPVRRLLADQERRAKEGAHPTVQTIGLDKLTDKSKRIAALIRDLDQTDARQWSQPGGVWLGEAATVKALIAEGEGAVEPLLDCLERDQRLTRSVEFGRDFNADRNVLPVRVAAQSALDTILRVEFKEFTAYRSYWEKYKSQPMEERWYRTLADDQAGRQLWMQAAINILSRVHGKIVYEWGCAPKPNATNHYVLTGENLRSKTQPSVAELFVKRALEIAPQEFTSSADCWSFEGAAKLGLMLAEWDPKTARTALGKIIQRCPALSAPRESWDSGCAVVLQKFAALAVTLAELGDTTGLDAYAQWVQDKKWEDLRDALPGVLRPLGRFPQHPSIKAASVKLFRPGNSNWLPGYENLLGTRLLLNDAFQVLVRAALEDRTEAGTIVLEANDQYTAIYRTSTSKGGLFKPDGFAPSIGQVVSFRVCDEVAYHLKRVEGLPPLQLYWPQPKRDEAVLAIIKFFETNGANLKLGPANWPLNEEE